MEKRGMDACHVRHCSPVGAPLPIAKGPSCSLQAGQSQQHHWQSSCADMLHLLRDLLAELTAETADALPMQSDGICSDAHSHPRLNAA